MEGGGTRAALGLVVAWEDVQQLGPGHERLAGRGQDLEEDVYCHRRGQGLAGLQSAQKLGCHWEYYLDWEEDKQSFQPTWAWILAAWVTGT